jgi:hypothetical protein
VFWCEDESRWEWGWWDWEEWESRWEWGKRVLRPMAWASKVPCGEEEEGGEYILIMSLEEADDKEGKKE